MNELMDYGSFENDDNDNELFFLSPDGFAVL